jgi:hypothetical protein
VFVNLHQLDNILRRAADRQQMRLTRKLAECLSRIDLSLHRVGDVLMPQDQAELLIAEGWAMSLTEGMIQPTSHAVRQVRRLRELLSGAGLKGGRRAEDRIREDLHDSRARTIGAKRS